MKIMKTGIRNVAKLIDTNKLSIERKYRLSYYIYLYEENNMYLIQNTMTNEIMELSSSEWSAVKDLCSEPQDYDYLEQNGIIELAEKRYIVETDYNELKQYQQVVFLLKTMSGEKKGISSYTILPTTGCNARCVYCYEEGFAIKNMTPETADRVVSYICETRQEDQIRLHWFGGEPLSKPSIIRQICTQLNERGVPFKSTMVTNASLITKELAHEAKELWNLKKVQVSLDGVKSDYSIRKNYYNPEKHNYDVVMKAIHYLADEGIDVKLRVNVDLDNIERIGDFLKEMKNTFGEVKNISLYLSPLNQANHNENCIDLYKKILKYNQQIQAMNHFDTQHEKKKMELRLIYCMADNIDKSVVITPDGTLSHCDQFIDGPSWGNIFDGVTDHAKFEELKKRGDVDAKCAKCPFLPICTPFYKKGCPAWFEKCFEYRCLMANQSMHDLLKGESNEKNNDNESI